MYFQVVLENRSTWLFCFRVCISESFDSRHRPLDYKKEINGLHKKHPGLKGQVHIWKSRWRQTDHDMVVYLTNRPQFVRLQGSHSHRVTPANPKEPYFHHFFSPSTAPTSASTHLRQWGWGGGVQRVGRRLQRMVRGELPLTQHL